MVRLVCAVAVLVVMTESTVLAQERTMQSQVVRGTCESPGDAIAELTAPVVPQGEPTGAPGTLTAGTSFSTAPIALATMLADPTALLISFDEDLIACSNIGGVANTSGDLVLGFIGVDTSDAFGIAYISPNDADPSQTDVSLFVVPPTNTRADANGSDEAKVDVSESVGDAGEAIEDASSGSSESQQSTDPTSTSAPTPTPMPTPTPEPPPIGTLPENPAPIGTTVVAQDLAVTITGAYLSYGYSNTIPDGGYTFLVLTVQIQNVGDSDKRYNIANFSGSDLDSSAGYDAGSADSADMLRDGTLSPQEYVTGVVIIQVQETARRALIKYDPAMFNTEDAYWVFQG